MAWAVVNVERDGFQTTVIDGERVVSISDTLRDGSWDADGAAIAQLRTEGVTRVEIWDWEDTGLVRALRDAGFEVQWVRSLSQEEAVAYYAAHPEDLPLGWRERAG